MGSPKQPQRLQLTRPDGTSENLSLRSPISSKIWQAEDPTCNSGFDREDLCMRNFCVSVHGDHELMEGSFSFDTDGDDILEIHRDFSVDADGAYSFHEVREDQSSSKQGDLNCKSDSPQTEAPSKQSLEKSSNITSVSDRKDLINSENLMNSQGEILHVPTVSDVSLSMVMNTDVASEVPNLQGETDTEKENVNGKSESLQLASRLGNQARKEILAEVMAECKEVTNGEMSTKTYASNLLSLNSSSDIEEKNYRSIAISPIVPPDGSSSFTFQTGITLFAKNSSGRDNTGKNDELPKTYSCELTPAEGEAEAKVQYRSIAVSPIIPPGETSLFQFQKDNSQEDVKGCCSKQTSETREQEKLKDGSETKKEYKSVAVSPIIPPAGSSSFTFHTLRTVSGNTAAEQEAQNKELLPKTYSFELTPPNYDVGTQADTRAECVSVAVSPIIPPDGSSSFIFQSDLMNKIGGEKVPDNVSTQGGTRAQYVSVAISPIVLPCGSSSFTFIADTNGTEPNKDITIKTTDNLPKTYSFELTPPDDEPSTSRRVEYKSVAVSPIIPPDEVSFSFQTGRKNTSSSLDALPKTCSIELTPPNQDIGTQADKVECVSVAVSPIVISSGSSSFSFQGDQVALHHDQTQKLDSCSISAIPNRLPEPTTLYHDIGIQVDTIVQCASIAVSPMVPLQGSCSFVFQTEDANQVPAICSHVQEKPEMKDAEMQVSFPVETRSIATDPMTPKGKTPQASYPDVKVKEAKADHPEPVREVSWDEKGMTWEVYGASMEVEVLGMAIQKHLEKQIEEHERQKVMTPQNTVRGSSVRGTVVKNESKKRQPGTFRSFFRRRSRCCSHAGATAE
ncbi:G protein-regulated inducer of neurite outgrowth 1 [Bufo gargarizans]|uniref:G protein-regulated inducer of neurite outgrowth 1 n=1 Tax=Bufo gargarizans TaxID=30331 RepID=UPI001CF318A0|nr:G protein-regulated inducer of neurite outgrowth 1 [Bufo gargarizans]